MDGNADPFLEIENSDVVIPRVHEEKAPGPEKKV